MRDVGQCALVVERLAVRIADDSRVLEHEDELAVLTFHRVLEIAHAPIGLHLRLEAIDRLRIGVVCERAAALLERPEILIAEHRHERGIGRQPSSARRDLKDTIDHVVEQLPEAQLTDSELVRVSHVSNRDSGELTHAFDEPELRWCRVVRGVEIHRQRTFDPILADRDRAREACV